MDLFKYELAKEIKWNLTWVVSWLYLTLSLVCTCEVDQHHSVFVVEKQPHISSVGTVKLYERLSK